MTGSDDESTQNDRRMRRRELLAACLAGAAVVGLGLVVDGDPVVDDIRPLLLIDYEDGVFGLVLYDHQMPRFGVDLFRKHGASQDGCAWSDVAETWMRLRSPAIRKKVSFDCEAGMMVIRGPRGALVRLAEGMLPLTKDAAALDEMLRQTTWRWY